ncbi:MAG: cadmium-translocating P-type ATPase [Candidatus Eisenbacteria bacterium]|uniref:Cadmium-translocating P-type ATPase n=1 Tax=Eiseniibacteriota bacterium TaxID=2212470 RepID=A0A849SZ46_UNCEI|nr:cadmium-translocating P-type ATPase [Candidatus Eisenbacteria bacterium]
MNPNPASEPQLEHLPIAEGEGCLEILSERLAASPGVVGIEADFAQNLLTVRYQPGRVAPDQLNALADEVAALFAQRVTRCERRAAPGACEECALRLGRVPGARRDEFVVIADPGHVGIARREVPRDTIEFVRPFANRKPWGARMTPAEQATRSKSRAMITLTVACLLLLLIGLVLERTALPALVSRVVLGVSALAGSWFALRSTFAALAKRRFDVNLLMLLAAAGAAAIGFVTEAAELMFLFSLSNTLEVYTMGRTRRALHALLKLRPSRALVRRSGREVQVEAEDVRVGEIVIVKPGETLPVDGAVVLGASLVDQSSLTGESVPVTKEIGDRVFAGTLNQQGALEVRTLRAAGDTTLARIVTLVEEAQEQKSRTEELAEWVGRYYTVAVVVAAVLMIAIPLLLRHPFAPTFYRAMTLLVVASPCALVIATPSTVLSAIANAARNGILFKGGRFLEALGRAKAVAFDKTGTLTAGRFEVTDVVALPGVDERELLAWAAAAEKRSQHPLAQAVVRAAEVRGVTSEAATHLTTHLGKGVVARVSDATIEIGTPALFESLSIPVPAPARERVEAFMREAKTAMLVRRGDQWGVIAAADQIRPTAAATVAALKACGIRSVTLLSGDSRSTVAAIARQLAVDDARGELLPEDKVNAIAELEARHGAVVMVGDGVNDAPALARATVGVAMGGVGSDAALESADLVLMADDLRALPYAVKLAQRARVVVAQNVTIAVGVMALLVVWVFMGQHTPFGQLRLPIAVSGHEGSTVLVILNGLRLLVGRRTA